LNRQPRGKTLLALVIEHFDQLDRWSSDLAGEGSLTCDANKPV
jgi:hypothetical protein